MKRLWLGATIALGAMTACAAVPSVYDAFDSGYTTGYTFDAPANGWRADSAAAMVTNSGAYSPPNVAYLSGGVSLSNTVSADANLRLWTDLQINPVLGIATSDPTTNTSSFYSFFTLDGYLSVGTPAGFLVCSNDIWGSPVPPSTNGYARVSIFQDYRLAKQAVFVNGQLVLQDLAFITNAVNYNQFQVRNSESNCWLDNVWVQTNLPGGLSSDRNGDGMSEAQEIQTYGYACRTQYVGGAGYPAYGSIAAAVAAARARDTIYVPTGPYGEDILVSNAIRFVGGAFTNSGTLTVRSTGVVFQADMTWGTVVLDTNSVATLSQGLACSNLIVAPGATVTVTSVTCSNVSVGTNARLTCLGAFACANLCWLDQGAVVAFSNTVTCPGSLTLAALSTVTLARGATVGVLNATGTVSVAAGQLLTIASATVPGLVLAAAGATVDVTTALSLPIGGALNFTQAEFIYLPIPADIGGTFMLGNAWWQNGALTIPPGANCTFHTVVTNPPVSSVEVGTNAIATFTQAVTCSNLTIRTGAVVTMAALACSNLTVETGARFTCLGPFQCSGVCSFGQGALIDFAGTTACAGSLTVTVGATVAFDQGATLGSLTADGTVTVGAGQTLTVTTASVAGSVQVTGAGAMNVNGSLSVTGTGLLTFATGHLTVPASQVDMTGTFTISSTWGTAATIPLPFADNFESYASGTMLTSLGFRGWYASTGTVMVGSIVRNGGNNAVVVPDDAVLSNSVNSATAPKVWTDFYLQPMLGLGPEVPATNRSSFLAYVNTNGCLVVATNNGWLVCSNKVDNTPVPPISSNAFVRISVCQDYRHGTFAVFVGGDLVAQGLNAPTRPAGYSAFVVNNIFASAYVDDLSIAAGTVPPGLTSDLNHNGTPDANEINFGEYAAWPPHGSVFIMR